MRARPCRRPRAVPRAVAVAVAALAALAALGPGAGPAHADELKLRVAGGAPGGSYHALADALATRVRANGLGAVSVSVIETAGSLDNVRRLVAGEADIALVQSDVLYEACQPGGVSGAHDAVRAVGALMSEVVHIVARKDAQISGIEDLTGLRVAAGVPGSGTASSFRELLASHRMALTAVKRRYAGDAEAPRMLAAGDLDVWVTTTAVPSARVAKALESEKAELVPIAEDVLAEIGNASPYFRPGEVEAGAYPHQPAAVPAVAVHTIVAARAGVPDVLVGEVLRVLHQQRSALSSVHPRAGDYDLPQTAKGIPIALHPGAISYYQANDSIEFPVKVLVGLYLLDIGNLDLKSGTFDADFYLWFRWKGTYLEQAKDGFPFELVHGTITNRSDPVVERFGPWTNYQLRLKATMQGDFLLHRYPFDSQALRIEIESPDSTVKNIEFVPDDRPQFAKDLRGRSLDEGVVISDWQIADVSHHEERKVYRSDFGSPYDEAEGVSEYSRYVYSLRLKRRILPYLIKFVVPLVVIVLMSFSVFFIHPQEFEVQAGIVITALLSCVAFHLSQVDALPEVGYLVTADKFFLVSYAVIFFALVEVVAENHYFHLGRLDVAHRLDRIARWAFPSLFFGVLAYLFVSSLATG